MRRLIPFLILALVCVWSAFVLADSVKVPSAVDTTNHGNIVMSTGKAVQTGTSAGNTAKVQAYDVDGAAYVDGLVCTANNTPACTLTGSLVGNADTATSASGLVCSSCVDLTSEVSGILPIADGGTNTSAITSNRCLRFDGTKIVAASGDCTAGDTDTTCNDAGVSCLFAGSASEGGPATTALALDANPADCGSNSSANAIAASGALTCSPTATGDGSGNATGVACSGSCVSDGEVDDTITASNYIAKAFVDAKGDLISASGNDTPAILGVGTDGQILISRASTATGRDNVTISGDGAISTTGAFTIQPQAVTLAKLVNASTTDLSLCRKTAAAGSWEECTYTDMAQDFASDTAGSTAGSLWMAGGPAGSSGGSWSGALSGVVQGNGTSVPTAVALGDAGTRAEINSSGAFVFAAGHGTRVYNNANESINDSTATILTFNTERQDTDAYHSTSSNTGRITIPTGLGGWYSVWCDVLWAASVTGTRNVNLRVNGGNGYISNNSLPVNSATLGTGQLAITLYYAAAGDYFECVLYQTSGGALNALSNWNDSLEFAAVWLGS